MKPSPMQQMTALGADWWNDSGAPRELEEAVRLGAVGGTSNPVIVSQAVKADPALCTPLIDALLKDHPHANEDEIAWLLIHMLARESAARLLPVYEASRGVKGFLSVQVNPKLYPNRDAMVAQATELAALAPNIAIKMPATAAGIAAMEEATARGIRVNATVSFSVAQAVAVAVAFDRGLRRAPRAETIRPYITIMIGRVDDHLKRVAEKTGVAYTPGLLDWAGIAVFKEAHRLVRQRGYPGTLLAAAYRHQGHWSEIIGPEVLQTVPYSWWKRFDASGHRPELTLGRPVDDAILTELRSKFPDFNRAHDERGMTPAEFKDYGATLHTLQQFLGGYADLVAQVRSRMVPA